MKRPFAALSLALLAALPAGASAACPVYYEPSKAISGYLANAERAMAKIRAVTASSRCGGDGTGALDAVFAQSTQSMLRLGNETVEETNEVSDFSSFGSTWEFYVEMPVAQPDAPTYLYRDADLLEREHDKIQMLGKVVARKCGLDAVVPAGSVEIKDKAQSAYPAPGEKKTVSAVLGDLTRTNGDVLTFFRSVAVGRYALRPEGRLEDAQKTPFFPDGGGADVRATYGTDARDACRTDDPDFQRLATAGWRVATFWSAYGDATKYWQEGYELLTHLVPVGGQEKKYNDAEKAILARELARQGIGGKAADKILNNLDTSNDASHQGLTGFLKSAKERVLDTFTGFGSGILQEYGRFNAEADKFRARADSGDTGISANLLSEAVDGKGAADALAMDLAANYMAVKILTDNGDGRAASALRILVDAHNRLQFTYQTIVDTFDDATKVCNSQGANITAAQAACDAPKNFVR